MYAIIQDGGKQYKVAPGAIVDIEKRDCKPGTAVEFPHVIYFHEKSEVKIGTPTLLNMKVKGVVQEHIHGPKITIIKYRRTKDSRCKRGHRQWYTRVRIAEIVK
jgi:large subunit ribosomal protein L21